MAELVEQPTAAPTRKIKFTTIGAAIGFLVPWGITKGFGLSLDDNATAAISFLAASFLGPLFGYFAKEKAPEV